MFPKKYLTRKEVSEHLRVTTRTVDNYIRKGKIKAIKLDSIVRIEAKSVFRFINNNPVNCLWYLS